MVNLHPIDKVLGPRWVAKPSAPVKVNTPWGPVTMVVQRSLWGRVKLFFHCLTRTHQKYEFNDYRGTNYFGCWTCAGKK